MWRYNGHIVSVALFNSCKLNQLKMISAAKVSMRGVISHRPCVSTCSARHAKVCVLLRYTLMFNMYI